MKQQKLKVENALAQVHLKKTPVRITLLSHFMTVDYAQSYFDIEKAFNKKFDKSTVYRTLGSFEETGLLHRIDDASGITKYGIGRFGDGHNHYHFICNHCKNTYCIENDEAELISLPKGFKSKHINMIIDGICANC